MIVTLTPSEIQNAYNMAGQWINGTLSKGVKGKYGAPEGIEGEMITLIGIRAEIAVAKALNLYWSGNAGNYKGVDVGQRVEVRSITSPNHRLILHDENRDDLPYVLAYLPDSTSVHLMGWLFGRDCKRDEYRRDPVGGRPAYFVPQAALRDMPSLSSHLGTSVPEKCLNTSSTPIFL